jgi:two-component sensor histidine kinase
VAGAALQDVFDESPLRDGVGTTVERTLPDAAEATGVPVLVSSAELQRPTSDELEVVVVAQDISALKRTEAALKQSVREKEVLLREVHHRVKNNLQIVCSLLHAEETAVSDPVVRQRFSSLQNRIRSMAAIHEQLYEAEDLSRVPFASYLRDLAPHLVRAHGAPPTCLRVDAEPLSLPVSTALPLGIVVTELVGNAFTHAFPEGEPGVVTIELRRRGEDAVLTVSDEGVGAQGWPDGRPDPSSPPPEADAPAPATGLGLRLVRGFVRQIRGCVEIDVDAGTHVRVTFPPPAPAGSPPSEATP